MGLSDFRRNGPYDGNGRAGPANRKRQVISTYPDSRPALAYRPAIDGMRAIAVLAVVLYHFGLPVAGGFTGVDVFFVISGFLIGGLLWQEGAGGRISLARFWLRRIRRLAPAYFAMAAATMIAAWHILLPFEFRETGKELIAATLWLANVLFWRGAGYFDAGAETKPFLHMWSLSVEEQFYIFLPLAFLLLLRWRRALPWALAAVWAGSLAASVLLTPTQPVTTFYLFPFRAWEMLTGVLLAILLVERPAWRLPPLAGWIGLALILAGIAFIPAGAGFPGWRALVPVTGAALMLWARDEGILARALAHPGPVFVGLISYSLYLWHWPVWVLALYRAGGEAGMVDRLVWLALALALSILSWALVERPLRRAAWIGPRLLTGGFVVSALVAVAAGLWIWRSDGAPARFAGSPAAPHIAASQDFLQDWSRCAVAGDGPFAGVETCAIGPEGPPRAVFWGDSHLRALMDGIALAAQEAGVPGVIIWHAGCPPLPGVTKRESAATPAEDAACAAATDRTLAGIAEIRPESLLLVGRWTYYETGRGIGRDAANLITLTAGDPALAGADQAETFRNAMADTMRRLSPLVGRLGVLRQTPELPDYDSRAIARGLVNGGVDPAAALAAGSVAPRDVRLPSLPPLEAAWIDAWPLICGRTCDAVHDGQGWYFDNNHLTNAGARALAPLFAAWLADG